jgi:hypothetical protein
MGDNTRNIVVDVLDPISDLLEKSGHKIVFKYEDEKIWNPKGISLKRRIAENPKFANKVDKVLRPNNLKKYVIPVDPKAPTRCVDGRLTAGWEKFSQENKTHLGPKIAGGTAHAALAHRIVDTEKLTKDLIFEHDIQKVVEKYKEIGIGFGGHVDDHQSGWNTGCGAVDNINKILERIQLPEPQEQLRGLTKLIIGKTYEHHMINEVVGRMLYLDALKPSYMPKEGRVVTGEFLYKKTVVDLLRKEAGSKDAVPQLIGEHGEVAAVLNFVKGTTIDTDRFSFDNKNEIQVFGWDVWEIYEEAARLFPYDMHDFPLVQQSEIFERVEHIITRTLLGIATLMVLTDGSLKVVTIKKN